MIRYAPQGGYIMHVVRRISRVVREKVSVRGADAVILSPVDDKRLESKPCFGVRNRGRACGAVDAPATRCINLSAE